MDNGNALLPPFLRSLANKIESGNISNADIERVGRFYMSYLFENQVEQDNKKKTGKTNTEKDFQKFIVLGWYIYTQILENE